MKLFLTRLLSILLILAPLLVLGCLLWIELVPSGVFVVAYTPGASSPYIDRLLPDQRVEPPRETDVGMVQRVTGDPAFFFLHPHRAFDSVDVEVHFKNEGVPIVELGGLAANHPEVYDLQPLASTILDDSSWNRVQDGDLLLLQRDSTYASMQAFLANPPSTFEVATYQSAFPVPTRLPEYVPTSTTQTMDISLRGAFSLKTYIKNEPLRFDVSFMDMNRDAGLDSVALLVTNEAGETVGSAYANDDGDSAGDVRASGLQHLSVLIPSLPEGVYKLEWRAGDDIFVRRLETTQSKIVFLDTLFLGDEAGWRDVTPPVHFFTDAKHLVFSTTHATGVQEVRLGSKSVSVSAPYIPTPMEIAEDGVVEGVSPKGDLALVFDGVLAFSPEQFFRPDPVRLRWNTDLDRLGINYVFARYTPPEKDVNGFSVARATFDAKKLLLEDGTWKIAFSLPGVEELGTSIDVGEIKVTFRRAPFVLDDLLTALKRFF